MKQSQSIQQKGEPSSLFLSTLITLGFFLLLVSISVWLGAWFFLGAPYGKMWQIIFYASFLGRAATVGVGREFGFSPTFLFLLTSVSEFTVVCLVFPVFVKGYKHLTRIPYIGTTLDNLHTVALNYKPVIAPYGFLGLMIFVLFPFWSTGPLVGSILGYIIGMSVGLTLVAVNSGNIIAIAAWVWFYEYVNKWNSDVATMILVVVLLVALLGVFWGTKRKQRVSTPQGGAPLDKP